MSFFVVQCLDGFATTRDNVEGELPTLVGGAGFGEVQVVSKSTVPLGTITLMSASNPIA
jgi:hypothetical protein